MTDWTVLPPGLPGPEDDGAGARLLGLTFPKVTLDDEDGRPVSLPPPAGGRTVVFVFPMTGGPGVATLPGWDAIPGARGCTAEACAFRDLAADLAAAGADRLYGLSTQTAEHHREASERLHLPYRLLSDSSGGLAAFGLPTFAAAGGCSTAV